MKCVIYDFDGTLSIIKERRHFLSGDTPDWEGFYMDSINDKPNIPLVELYKTLWNHFPMVICTSRFIRYRKITEDWMKKQDLPPPYELLMRESGDLREDSVVKKQMLKEIIEEGLTPLFAVEDRNDVTMMYRKEGIVCLQCADNVFVMP